MSSFDVEQPTRDTIPVVMHEQQVTHERQVINEKVVYEQQFMPEERVIPEHWLDLQSVADFAGKLSKDVSVYVRGLVGSWNWSFNSTPYFQNSGRKVGTTGVVNLVPERKPDRQIMQSLGDAADTWSNASTFSYCIFFSRADHPLYTGESVLCRGTVKWRHDSCYHE
jgi:hypothetical protein